MLHSVPGGLISADLESGWAVLHGTNLWSRHEVYWLIVLPCNLGSEEFQAERQCSLTVRLHELQLVSVSPLEGSAVEAGYLAERCLCDQENMKVLSWDCILDFLALGCSWHTSMVTDLSEKVYSGRAYGAGMRRFHLGAPDSGLWCMSLFNALAILSLHFLQRTGDLQASFWVLWVFCSNLTLFNYHHNAQSYTVMCTKVP